MTIQKFFRINGTSTQLKGVVPDIILPDNYQFIKRGEKDYDYPLEWNEIESVDHTQNAYVISNYDELRIKSEKRVQQDSTFQLILENAHRLKESQEQRTYPLDLDAFIEKMDERQQMGNRYKDIGKDVIPGLVVENLNVDMDYIQADSSRIGRNEDFISKLTKDIYLKETIHILDDMTPDTVNAGNE
jgi:carboxyl-terminal processing protease